METENNSPDKVHCPSNCPFLDINYFEAFQKIPYHCDFFQTFLGFDGQVIRCSECLGVQRSVKEEGLNFINAYTNNQLNRKVTKLGFLRLFPNIQSQFVQMLKKHGTLIGIIQNKKIQKKVDIDKIQKEILFQLSKSIKQQNEDKKETEELTLLLKKQGDALPDGLDDEMCKFLIHLYNSLGSSERADLLQILRNPNTLDIFLKRVRQMPRDNDFLANIRLEIERILPESLVTIIPLTEVVKEQIIQDVRSNTKQ